MFQLFATPWWVNLAFLAPLVAFWLWRKEKLDLTRFQLFWSAAFAIAFGIEEAIVVIYLRAAAGLHDTAATTLAQLSSFTASTQADAFSQFVPALISTEILREATTIIVLVAIALLAVAKTRERWAIFLWSFALWDIFYYVGLYLLVGWPPSLLTPDVLFLIPVVWMSQVWFPLLVCVLMLATVLARTFVKKVAATS